MPPDPVAKVAPKGELHLHLEGSVDAATLLEIDPALTRDDVHTAFQFHDFPGFIQAYKFVALRMRTPAHYALATTRLVRLLEQQNVKYAEINLSVGVMLFKQQNPSDVFDAIRLSAAHSGIKVQWIFDAVWQFGAAAAMRVAELAAERLEQGVIAFGIGGDESQGGTEFDPVFKLAERRGLKLVPHAGENTSAQAVWNAVRAGAFRIGHGIRSVDDPVLLRCLRDNSIPLEICITSNVRTGAVESLSAHPVRRIFDAGVPITLNTDDPALFQTSLDREFEIAQQVHGFTSRELDEIRQNAFRFASSPAEAAAFAR